MPERNSTCARALVLATSSGTRPGNVAMKKIRPLSFGSVVADRPVPSPAVMVVPIAIAALVTLQVACGSYSDGGVTGAAGTGNANGGAPMTSGGSGNPGLGGSDPGSAGSNAVGGSVATPNGGSAGTGTGGAGGASGMSGSATGGGVGSGGSPAAGGSSGG